MAPLRRSQRSPGGTPPTVAASPECTPEVKTSSGNRPKIMLKLTISRPQPKPQPQPQPQPEPSGGRRTSARNAAARNAAARKAAELLPEKPEPPSKKRKRSTSEPEKKASDTRKSRRKVQACSTTPGSVDDAVDTATNSTSNTTIGESEVEDVPEWGPNEVDAAALLVQLFYVDRKSKFEDDRDGSRMAGAESLIALSRGAARGMQSSGGPMCV